MPAGRGRIELLQSTIAAELRDAAHSVHIRGVRSSHAIVPAIETLDIADATAGFRTWSEYWIFRLPQEQTQGFPISISLAHCGTYFVVLTLIPLCPPTATFQSPPIILSTSLQSQAQPTPLTPSPPPHGPSEVSSPYPVTVQSPAYDFFSSTFQVAPQAYTPVSRILRLPPTDSLPAKTILGVGARKDSKGRCQYRRTSQGFHSQSSFFFGRWCSSGS